MSSVEQCCEVFDSSTARNYLMPMSNYNNMSYPQSQQLYFAPMDKNILSHPKEQDTSFVEITLQLDPVPSKPKRSRTAFSNFQVMVLEKEFKRKIYLSRIRRIKIAQELSLPEKQIMLWFQNRRMKYKKETKPSANAEHISTEENIDNSLSQPYSLYFDGAPVQTAEILSNSSDLPQASNIYPTQLHTPDTTVAREIPTNSLRSDFFESVNVDLRQMLERYSPNTEQGSQNISSTSLAIEPSSDHVNTTLNTFPDLSEILDQLCFLDIENTFTISSTVDSIRYDLEASAEEWMKNKILG